MILGSQPPQKKDLGASPLNSLNLIREALPGAGRTLGCDFFRKYTDTQKRISTCRNRFFQTLIIVFRWRNDYFLFFFVILLAHRSPLQFSQPPTHQFCSLRDWAYAAIISSTIQPTTNPPIVLFARLIFQSRSYKFSTPNFPLTKKL